MAEVDRTCRQIQEAGAVRVAVMKAEKRLTSQSYALARRMLGWKLDLPEVERTEINDRARKVVDDIEERLGGGLHNRDDQSTSADPEGGGDDHKRADTHALSVVAALTPYVAANLEARAPLSRHRKVVEKELSALAEQLPAWTGFVEGVPGIGATGFGVLVAETGNIGTYANPAKLWKRMGVAVIDGERQRLVPGEMALVHGYNPRRRSVLWNLADALIRYQASKRCDPEKAYYGDLYRAERLRQVAMHPEFDRGEGKVTAQCDLRARRYVSKRFLKDLWGRWRGEREANLTVS